MAILQTTGVTGSLAISSSALTSGSVLLSVDGLAGRLFSIDDNLSGSLFSVNTIAGLPIIEAFSDNTVNIGKYNAEAIRVVDGGQSVALGSGSVMYISSSGRVGIGTTNPTDSLDFGNITGGKNIIFSYSSYGETRNSLASIIGNNVKASPTTNSQVRRFASTNDSGSFIKIIYNKGITFHTNITSSLNTDISEDTNERVRIDLNGNVGISTTSPANKLSVIGAVNIGSTTYNTTAPANGLIVEGNVGIGVTNPVNKLSVAGNISCSVITASLFSGSLSGSTFGTSSWATNSLTASFLPVGTYAVTSSWSTNALTASSLVTSNSYTITNLTASNISASNTISSSNLVATQYIYPNNDIAFPQKTSGSYAGFSSNPAGGPSSLLELIHCLSNAIGVNDPLRFRTVSTPQYFSASAWFTDANPPAYGRLIDGNATSVVPVITFNDSSSLSINSKRFVVSFDPYDRPNFITIQSDYGNNAFYGYSVGIEKQSASVWLPAVTTQTVANGSARLIAFQLGDLFNTDALRFTFTATQALSSGGVLNINSIRSYNNQNYSSTIPVYTNSGSQLIATNNVGIGSTAPRNRLDVAGNISCSVITASLFSGSLSGSMFGTSSWSINSLTASTLIASNNYTVNNLTASNISASGFVSSSNFVGAHTGSTFGTSSWASNSLTASSLVTTNNYTVNNLTASNISASGFVSSSNFVGPHTGSTFGTASWAINSLTASSLVTTNNYIINNLNSNLITASLVRPISMIELGGAYDAAMGLTPTITAGSFTSGGPTFRNLNSVWSVASSSVIAPFPTMSIDLVSPAGANQVSYVSFGTYFKTDTRFIPFNYRIETSSDNVAWTTQVTETTNTNLYPLHSLSGEFRYIRLILLAGQTSASVANGYACNVSAFRVFSQKGAYINDGFWARRLDDGPAYAAFTNNIGIGTTNPANRLTLIGAASIGSTTYNTAAPANGLIVEGNVGVGTVTPTAKLNIASTSQTTKAIIQSLSAATGLGGYLAFNPGGDSTYSKVAIGVYDNYFSSFNRGNLAFMLNSASNSTEVGFADTKLYISASGNVGIGTTNPANILTVIGATSIGSTTYNTAAPANGLIVEGNVGIGVTNPVNKLSVAGNISCSVITASNFFGTASWANSASVAVVAQTASFLPIGTYPITSSWSTNALTASFLPVGTYNITSSWANNALTASSISSTSNAFIRGGNSFGANAMLGLNDNFRLDIETNGAAVISLTGSNVGIGTTAPNSKLEVAGTAGTGVVSVTNTGNGRSGSFGIDNSGVYIQNSNNGDYFDLKNATGTSRFRVIYDTNTYLNTTFTSIGSLTASGSKLSVFGNLSVGSTYGSTSSPTNGAIFEGNVGIGTTNPVNKLDVVGNISCSVITASNFFGTASWATNALTAGIATGETLATVTGRGASTSTQITVSTAAGGSMYTGVKAGSSYSDGISGATFKSITDNPNGGSYAFASYYSGSSGFNSFFVAADGTGYFSGSLGIGTSSPANKLSVIGAVNIGSSGYNTTAPANGLIVEGSVGVGTTSPDTNAKIHIQGNAAHKYIFYTDTTAASSSLFQRNSSTDSIVVTFANTRGPSVGSDRGTSINLDLGYGGSATAAGTLARGAKISAFSANTSYTSDTATQHAYLGFFTSLSGSLNERFRIDPFGNVGIGITNPAAKLHVAGGNVFLDNAYYIGAKDTGGTVRTVLFGRWSDNATYLDAGTGGLYLRTNDSSTGAVFINAIGNVGIYTTNPVNKLDVVGNISCSVITASNFFGTASWANNALTAAFLPVGTYNITSSWANNVLTAAFATNATTATQLSSMNISQFTNNSGYLTSTGTINTASYANALNPANSYTIAGLTVNGNISASGFVSSSNFVGPHTGSTFGTASWATNATTATTANNVNNGTLTVNAGGGVTISGTNTFTANQSGNSALTVSLSSTNITVGSTTIALGGTSTVLAGLTSVTSTGFTGSLVGTSSWANNALTAAFLPVGTYNITSSWATNALTAGFAANATNATTATTATTANALNPANSYTIAGLTVNGNISASGFVSSSNFVGPHVGNTTGTASWANNALTASLLLGSVVSASFATTAGSLVTTNNYQVSNLTASTIRFSALSGSNGGLIVQCTDATAGINPQIFFIYGPGGGGDFTARSGSVDTLSFGFNSEGTFGGTAGSVSGRLIYFYDRAGNSFIGGISGNDRGLYWGTNNTNYSLRVLPPAAANIPVTIKAASGQTANVLSVIDVSNNALMNVNVNGDATFGRYVGVSAAPATTNPGRLYIKGAGDSESPAAIKFDSVAFDTTTNSSGKTFKAWLKVFVTGVTGFTDGTSYWVPIYS